MPEGFPNMPERMLFLSDRSGNTVEIGEDISAEDALNKMSEGYDVQLVTYVRQTPRTITSTASQIPKVEL